MACQKHLWDGEGECPRCAAFNTMKRPLDFGAVAVALHLERPHSPNCNLFKDGCAGGGNCDCVDDEPLTVVDAVNHPKHYTSHPSGIECIQVTEHMNFNVGNAVKYLWRCDEKGAHLEDLKKAAWYVNREIKRREKDATR